MVVLLILAILLAIAIPTFLGVTKSANDRAVQSNLNTALTDAKSTFETNGQSYGIGTVATSFATNLVSSLSSAEPNLSFTTGATTGQTQISVYVSSDGKGVILAGQAKGTANCWYAIDNSATETVTSNGPYTTLGAYTGSAVASSTAVPMGTFYGEAKNTGTAPTCSASAPVTFSSATTTWVQSGGFPDL